MLLWRHILRAHIAPFLFSTSVLTFIFLLQFIMQKLDQLAGKGLSAGVIIELIVMNLAWMVVLAVPMAVLVATLMAFGTMASTNEITAMRASGMSLYRMITPVFITAVLVCILLVQFNNEVLPDANHRAKILLTDIYRKKPTFSLMPGLFSQDISGYSILVRKTFEQSNDLEGVTIFDYTNTALTTTVSAQTGTISFSPDYRKLIMDLRNGEIHEINNQTFEQYRTIKFEKHRIAMNADGFEFQRSAEAMFSRGDRELSAQAMRQIVDSLSALQQQSMDRIATLQRQDLDRIFSPSTTPMDGGQTNPTFDALTRTSVLRSTVESEFNRIDYYARQVREYTVEIHKKYSIPFASIVFVLIGVPLGIMARKGTFGVAASLSLGFFLLYWAFLIGGEKLADRGFTEPWIGMWIANIVLGLLGVYLTIRTARENLIIDWSSLERLVPKGWRTQGEPA
ncbi:MAG: LptF/LptG family permease [Ignavibacteriales bacterium]|nr:LptF/LptG family permease [Ignavibacteriales bacterium]